MASFDVPSDALGKQHSASNPDQSVWVSANAGSGKTHVLASRVIRLLLQGVEPSKILCLTFTKAAAANMASGVFDKLAKWTQLADGDLSAKIHALGAPKPGSRELYAARKLFARTLETPGGLKIQTIHAFCERLLHLFPFEANVPARFEVLDEQGQAEVLQRARQAVLKAMSGKGALGAALERLNDECGPEGFDGLIKETMRQSAILRARWPHDPVEILRRSLDLAEGRDRACIEREMVEGGITPERWNDLAIIFERGSANDRKKAALFQKAALTYQSPRIEGAFADCVDCYLGIFFIDDGNGSRAKSLMTNGLLEKHPDIGTELFAEQERLERLREERKAAATCDRTRVLIEIASAIFKRYGEQKSARGVLDFDDLIDKTFALLQRSEARWVLYKLDSGIDHVLVDEAQDTSESQWKILEELTNDFAAGQGQSRVPRTFFAVGDEKQSIFSFQGAVPRMFDEMRLKFGKRFSDSGQSFERVPLNASFRSAPGVLAAIDKVFEHGEHKTGVITEGDIWRPHQALKHQLPALVELWPLVGPQPDENPRAWTLPLDLLDDQDPANLVAQRIAQKIACLIAPNSGECVHDSGTLERRPVRPGDILVLVRTRGPFFEAMIRALKKNHIQTAGADRLELAQHIAVMDLIGAGRASLLPHDDLTLACVLKSPLIGLDDDGLIALAPSRGAASLFDALQVSADPKHAAAAERLELWRARAGGGPFAFYAALLGADGGRRAIEARLGQEAGDVIDEFLNLAITHEGRAAASLAAFLNDLAGIEYSIKRDMETGGGTVRVMTVHAAKGLEAKIVFLPDTCSIPSPRHDPRVFTLRTHVPGEETIAWSPGKDQDCGPIAAARARAREDAMEEYRRLLYVALTRAEERLYIAGFHGEKKPATGCWAEMIEAALGDEAGIEKAPSFWNGEEEVLRLSFAPSGVAAPATSDGAAAAAPVVRPDWLGRSAPCEANASLPVTPSNVLTPVGEAGDAAMTQARRDALRRGRQIHLLLKSLPGIDAPRRRDAALAFLAAQAAGLDEMARRRLADEALNVIDVPDLAGLFGPGSKAEVAISGRITVGRRVIDVTGQVDRIGEDANEVLIADFKTGTPCGLDEIPAAYLTQLALYRAVLAPLWPNKTVRAMLIWTKGPLVVPFSVMRLDAVLAAYAG